MKALIIVSLLMTGAMAQALPNQEFQCANNIFRSARFEVLNNEILVQDSRPVGTEELGAALTESLDLKADLMISEVAIQVYKDHSVCATTLAPVLNCKTQAENATLFVKAFADPSTGLNGDINLRLNVKLASLDVQSNLSSDGNSVVVGNDPVTVQLNRVVLKATAVIVIDGKTLTLKFKPTFFNGTTSSNSYCKVL